MIRVVIEPSFRDGMVHDVGREVGAKVAVVRTRKGWYHQAYSSK